MISPPPGGPRTVLSSGLPRILRAPLRRVHGDTDSAVFALYTSQVSTKTNDVWQARLGTDSDRYDQARRELGLTRSEAIRHVLPFLEHEARQRHLAHEYDDFYGPRAVVDNSISP